MKVTCICPTMPSRAKWLAQAIQCFEAQSYGDAELIIVADDDSAANLAEGNHRIQLLILPEVVGTKRNFACSHAAGDVIVHWDDDDFSAPDRIAFQVARLGQTNKAVTGFGSMKFTDGKNWWLYEEGGLFGLGTSLCYLRSWWQDHRFEPLNIGQDEEFVSRAIRAGQMDAVPAGELMHATIHPGNTSPRTLSGDSWRALA